VFLGDGLTTKIVGQGIICLLLQDGWSRTLPGVLHIPVLERNLISIKKMSDVSVHTLFYKDTCKILKGALVLMKVVFIVTLYKLLGYVDLTGCNSIAAPKVDSTGCNNIISPEVDSNSTQLN
jgi:hypothetical protein